MQALLQLVGRGRRRRVQALRRQRRGRAARPLAAVVAGRAAAAAPLLAAARVLVPLAVLGYRELRNVGTVLVYIQWLN